VENEAHIIDITSIAVEIFGDIVDIAYLKKPSWSDEEEFGKIRDQLLNVERISIEPSDAYPIFVQFKNGHSFEIWSSEWGGVTKVTENEYLNKL
jgi:hypothetical protein